MARVASEPRTLAPYDLWPAPPIPWWAQAARDPAALLAFAFLTLLMWRPTWLAEVTALLSDRASLIAAWPVLERVHSTLGLDRPAIAIGLGIVGLLAVAWASFQLYHWIERVTRRSAGA